MDKKYTSQRLAYHYFWIFFVQFGTVVVYGFVIWELRRSSRRLEGEAELSSEQAKETHRRIRKSCLIMCCYPIAYIALTLPLAVSRMFEVGGTKSSLGYRVFCGCFLVSSGRLIAFHRLDVVANTMTRLGGLTPLRSHEGVISQIPRPLSRSRRRARRRSSRKHKKLIYARATFQALIRRATFTSNMR